MNAQRGFVFIEPILLMGLLTNPNVTNTALGSIMISLSLLALLCQRLRKGQAS